MQQEGLRARLLLMRDNMSQYWAEMERSMQERKGKRTMKASTCFECWECSTLESQQRKSEGKTKSAPAKGASTRSSTNFCEREASPNLMRFFDPFCTGLLDLLLR
jgi:hypothetical protein